VKSPLGIQQLFPPLDWARNYNVTNFHDDFISGVVVTFITVPQVIAYAFLAGLPAEMGLYAVIASIIIYSLLGTSRTMAVGPTAIVAMMTLEIVSALTEPGTALYAETAVKLSLMTGLVLIGLRIVNFGAVVNFMSHAVVTGFITAAAFLIIINQFTAALGLPAAPRTDFLNTAIHLFRQAGNLNLMASVISLTALILLLYCMRFLGPVLAHLGLSLRFTKVLVKSAPLYAVVLGVALVWIFDLASGDGVRVVGTIPVQLPSLEIILIGPDEFVDLLPSALLIAMVIFLESSSIGTAVASKRRQKIDPNQELVGLSGANIAAAFVGGFPVAGSFGRTMVNFASGAVTPVASLVTALCVVVTLLWLTPLFYLLPIGILSAIIIVAAGQLVDIAVIRKVLFFNRTDAVTFVITFFAVLTAGVETGILIGIGISYVLLIRSTSRPHIAVVGRYGNAQHFRNIQRYKVSTSPKLLMVRIDQSLYFVNSRYIESYLLAKVADNAELKHILIICSAINFIDASGLEVLESLNEKLLEVGVNVHLSEVKGPVMDTLKKTEFYENMSGDIYFTTDMAMRDLVDM